MSGPSFKIISCQELHDRSRQEEVKLIDVRTPDEFREVHASLAYNVPLDALDLQSIVQARSSEDGPLYVICRSGFRSEKACQMLAVAGCNHLINVEGGILAWEEAGLPVERI